MNQIAHKKRLISICDISPSKLGSFEEFLILLTEKLKENGYEHVIIFRERPISYVEDALLGLGAKVKIFTPSDFSGYNFLSLYKIVNEIQPNIIHFHFYPIYSVINYLKLFCNIKIVYTDHMGGRKPKSPFRKSLRKIYYYTNSKLFGYGINKIICVSKFTKLKYAKDYGIHPKNLCVIYNGINTDRFNKRCDISKIKEKYKIKDEFIITCVGLRKDKGVHCLIKEIPSIIKQIPNTKIILIGEGECRSYLEIQIQKYDINNYVIFTGQISNIEEVYSISSCVIMPTVVEEACPFTALESMAIGVPVIAFDSGGTNEIVIDGQNGYIIPKNSKVLAEKIIDLYENGNIDSMREDCKKRIFENFLLTECVNNYINLYNTL